MLFSRLFLFLLFFFFKQKTAYEMRISDWSSDVCSSDHLACDNAALGAALVQRLGRATFRPYLSDDLIGAQIGGAVKNVLAIACEIGRASWRERVCQYV